MTVSPEEFDAWIQEALAGLPARFATLAAEVSIVVEEEPSADVLQELELESEDDLLGLYQGVPIDKTSFFQPAGELPARISIYRGPILRLCEQRPKSFMKSETQWSMNSDTMSGWMTRRCRTNPHDS